MKVVKITKKLNGSGAIIEHHLVLFNEPYSNDDIDCLVEDWCDSSSCGYHYEWVFETDVEKIKPIIENKIAIAKNKIEKLNNEINTMISFL